MSTTLTNIVVTSWISKDIPQDLVNLCSQYVGVINDVFNEKRCYTRYTCIVSNDWVPWGSWIEIPLTFKISPIIERYTWSLEINHQLCGKFRVGLRNLSLGSGSSYRVNLGDHHKTYVEYCMKKNRLKWNHPLRQYFDQGYYVDNPAVCNNLKIKMTLDRSDKSLRFMFNDYLAKQGYFIRPKSTYRAFIAFRRPIAKFQDFGATVMTDDSFWKSGK